MTSQTIDCRGLMNLVTIWSWFLCIVRTMLAESIHSRVCLIQVLCMVSSPISFGEISLHFPQLSTLNVLSNAHILPNQRQRYGSELSIFSVHSLKLYY